MTDMVKKSFLNDEKRSHLIKLVSSAFKSYPDFPKPGITFFDIFGVFGDPVACKALFDVACDDARKVEDKVDVVVGLDSRGFLLAPAMAQTIQKPFVPARKAGKLPGACKTVEYSLEYGTDRLQIQEASIKQGDRVLIVDDLLATGGTMSAAVELVEKCGGQVVQCWVVTELQELNGRNRIKAEVEALIKS